MKIIHREDIEQRIIAELDDCSVDISDDGDGKLELNDQGKEVLAFVVQILSENGVNVN